ncbi:MAG: TRAP transporter fused permease subunit [Burkholderiaceae bacterium]
MPTCVLGHPPPTLADALHKVPLLSPPAGAGPATAPGCRLLLSEHRSGRPLLTLPLDPARPMAIVSFTHSVLGTPVSDRYLFKPAASSWRAHLVEERFEGSGYGLPHLPGEGETLTREGEGWRLQLDRVVEPLVILPLPSQLMRVRTLPGAREFYWVISAPGPSNCGRKTARPADGKPMSAHQSEVDRLIEQFDPESSFRRLAGLSGKIVTVLCAGLSLWHYYTAGFGLENEIAHRAIHLAVVLGLCFLVFPRQRRLPGPWEWLVSLGLVAFYLYMGWGLLGSITDPMPAGASTVFIAALLAIAGLSLPFRAFDGSHTRIPWRDWIFAGFASGFSLYLLVFFQEIFIGRPGDHTPIDLMMGVIAIAMVIEATRRTMGIFLPLLAIVTILYGLLGPYLPGGLAHRGYSLSRIVAHLYKGTEGIYGIPVGVVATFVFHFVLFGIMAQLTGLGQLFVNLATIAAGRYSGGPAKVSVVSSGLFGMISGSAIANTVTTGVMTIPLMKKVGFSPRFSGAVEASASCGGQVTPPIMGAAAFIMAETLGIPYNQLILVAIVPAALHYFAILYMVHLESRRLRLTGMDPAQIPGLAMVLRSSWHLFIPLVVMVTLLLMQYTPFLAAFWGITLTVACSWIPKLLGPLGRNMSGLAVGPRALVQGFEMGAKAALGIGAACACVGFVLGITTLTGMGFKFSAWVLDLSSVAAQLVTSIDVFSWFDLKQVTILFGLLFTAAACIVMGSGVPTTPTYIILAAIVAPALAQLGVPQLATHFFVFYIGVLADVTPPVALAAFAAAGIARSEPMRTGSTAFRLSMGKALVPFAFVYSPALLLIDFTWSAFLLAATCSIVAVMGLGAAYTGYFFRPIGRPMFIVLNLFSLSLIFANPVAAAVAIPVVLLILFWHARNPARAVTVEV